MKNRKSAVSRVVNAVSELSVHFFGFIVKGVNREHVHSSTNARKTILFNVEDFKFFTEKPF